MARPRLRAGELGNITTERLGARRYKARARVGMPVGPSRQIQAEGTTAQEARDNLAARAKVRSFMSSVAALGPHTTVAELVTLYIASTAKRSRPTTPQTRELYTRVTNNHLPTGLGGGISDLPLGDCGGQSVRAWLEDKHTTVPSTAKTLRSVLMGAFKWAENRGVSFWQINPAGGADIAVQHPEVKTLTMRDIRELRRRAEMWEGNTRPTPVTAILDVLAATGMRIGEALALRWDDLDLTGGTVTINGTVVDREGRKANGGGTMRQEHGKSANAHRTLTLPEWIIPDLLERRVQATGGLVFPNAWGGVLGPNGFRRKFRELRGNDFEWVTPHAYRRTVATAIAEASDVWAVMRQMGHSSTDEGKSYIDRASIAGDNRSVLEGLNPKR